jgi:hypothetical protein
MAVDLAPSNTEALSYGRHVGRRCDVVSDD